MKKYASDLSERQYAAIGKVAREWANVESTLRYIIGEIADIDFEVASIFTVELGSTSLLNVLFALLHKGNKSAQGQSLLYQHLKALEPRIFEERGKRNTIVHLDWISFGGHRRKAFAIKSTAKGKFQQQHHLMSAREIEAVAASIRELHFLVWQCFHDYEAGRLGPLPPKPPSPQSKRRNPQ